jgi:hypothetical protein
LLIAKGEFENEQDRPEDQGEEGCTQERFFGGHWLAAISDERWKNCLHGADFAVTVHRIFVIDVTANCQM